MRVGIDVSPLAQTRAGTARYIKGLLSELERLPDVEVRRLAFPGARRVAAAVRDIWWYPRALPRAARAARADVLHCPTFRGPFSSFVPLIVTVHDVAVFRHPDAFPRWSRSYGRIAVPRVLKAASRVIAVSEFTKRELVAALGVREHKISVVPNAVGPPFHPRGDAEAGDYVLAVATLEPRKNLPRLAEAARLAGVELRVVGAPGWGDVQVGGDGVRWLGWVSDAELARLYRGALCLAYPSVYEGFGIPVLEAMACGTPVVTSAAGATQEIADGAAVLVDPHDAREIAAGIEQAIARRHELARLGPERARRYSWADAAAATARVYREAAG